MADAVRGRSWPVPSSRGPLPSTGCKRERGKTYEPGKAQRLRPCIARPLAGQRKRYGIASGAGYELAEMRPEILFGASVTKSQVCHQLSFVLISLGQARLDDPSASWRKRLRTDFDGWAQRFFSLLAEHSAQFNFQGGSGAIDMK